MFKRIALVIVLLVLMSTGNLFSYATIDLVVYLANADYNGTLHVEQPLIGGGVYDVPIENANYTAYTREIIPYSPGTFYEFRILDPNNPEENAQPILDVYAYSEEQGFSNTYRVDLELPGQTDYESFLVFYNENIFRSIDLESFFDLSTSFDLLIYPGDKYFQFTGRMKVSQGVGNPQNYGHTYHIENIYGGDSRDIEIHPCTEWDVWTEFSVPIATYEDNPFFDLGEYTITFTGQDNGEGRIQIYTEDRKLKFEYVPDYSNPLFNISVASYETSPDEWHPKLQWTYNGYGSFFAGNPYWANYFETQIWRKKVSVPGFIVEDWTNIAQIDPDEDTYIDEDIESPAQTGGGYFGIEGTAYYKIILAQKPNNPNYDLSGNGIDDEFDFDYSDTKTILYGQNSGGGGQIPKLYMKIENITVFNYTTPNISFIIRDDSMVDTRVNIYNLKGQLIKTLLNEQLRAGKHTVVWDGRDENDRNVSNGIYLVRISRADNHISQKVTLIR